MVQVEDKAKTVTSESEAEKASTPAASEPMDTEASAPIPEGEEKKTAEANNNGNSPASVPVGDEKSKENGEVSKAPDADVEMSAPEDNKKDQENEIKVDNKLSTPGGSSRKRKRKAKKMVKKAATPSAAAKTPISEGAKTDVEAPANKEEEKKEAENASAKKGKRLRQRKKKKSLVPNKDSDKPETSTKENTEKKADSMGMIFMCSSKTKKDCYQYKVLGLPASKKEMVAKIYKGMRLFLFDIDLKLLYGIYKAAEPGGYNIEPKAFKSAFPSQVRFTVMEDCSPLPEEKFKEAIKENYYGKNKFDCQLKPEQVKSLCKLFRASIKTRDSKPATNRTPKKEACPSERRDRSRPITRDRERRPGGDRERRRGGDRDRRERRPGGDRERRQGRDRERRGPRIDDNYGRRPLLLSPGLPSTLPRTYAYERPLEIDYYRREPAPVDYPYREEMVYPEQPVQVLYRDPAPALAAYEPLYARPAPTYESYHEPLYTTRAVAPGSAAPPPVYHMPQLYRY